MEERTTELGIARVQLVNEDTGQPMADVDVYTRAGAVSCPDGRKLESHLEDAAGHRGNPNVHLTQGEKAALTNVGINAAAVYEGGTVAITAPAGAEFLTFYAPSDFSSGDSYTLGGTPITLTDLRGEPLEDAWKQGSPVQLVVKGDKAFFKAGAGGVNQTLPPQVTGLTARASGVPSIAVSWTNPGAYWAGTLIVRKAGSAPAGVRDGERVYDGAESSYTDTKVQYDTAYYYRAFPYNGRKQYQTLLTGAVVSAAPKKLPLPAQVTGFTATASYVPNIALTWVNPTANWTGTRIVRKVGSQPGSVTDGTVVYDGTGTSYTDTGVQAGVTYYYRAFPYNANKEYQTSVTGAVVSGTPPNEIPLDSMPVGTLVKVRQTDVTQNYKKTQKTINAPALVATEYVYSEKYGSNGIVPPSLEGGRFLPMGSDVNFIAEFLTDAERIRKHPGTKKAVIYAYYVILSSPPFDHPATWGYVDVNGRTHSGDMDSRIDYYTPIGIDLSKTPGLKVSSRQNPDGSYNLIQ